MHDEIGTEVLNYFKKKFADKENIKVVSSNDWYSRSNIEQQEYDAALHVNILISWRDVQKAGKNGPVGVAAVGVKLKRYKMYSTEPIGGKASNQSSDSLPGPLLIVADQKLFLQNLLEEVETVTSWFIPWVRCLDDSNFDNCNKDQSKYIE